MFDLSPASSRLFHRLVLVLATASLAVTLGVIVPNTFAPPAAAAECSGCVVVTAPTIGLSATARPGLQDVIDTKLGVAVYTPLTTGTVGGPGTVWLAGHRTTYGSVFNKVPSLVAGDPVVLIDDNGSHEYIVSRLLIVSESGWQSQVDIYDSSLSRLILQTSHPDHRLRYLIEAFSTGTAPCCFRPVSAVQTEAPVASTTVTPAPSVTPETPPRSKFGSIKS